MISGADTGADSFAGAFGNAARAPAPRATGVVITGGVRKFPARHPWNLSFPFLTRHLRCDGWGCRYCFPAIALNATSISATFSYARTVSVAHASFFHAERLPR